MTMTSEFQTLPSHSDDKSTRRHRVAHDEPPLVVQILSIIGFGVFSIVAVALAFGETWVAGMIVVILLAMTWSRSRTFGGSRGSTASVHAVVAEVAPSIVKSTSSGNASFDAYREDTMRRLRQEQEDFEAFLERLREAKDKTEFDQFMDDRARASRNAREDREERSDDNA